MVSVNEVYPQPAEDGSIGNGWNYMNAKNVVFEELTGKELTIKNAELKKLGQGEEARNKIVLAFDETEKKLALNSTNSKIIAEEFGDNTDEWTGKQIVLSIAKKNFAGKLVDGIQVETL